MVPELLNYSHMHDGDHARYSLPCELDAATLSCAAHDVEQTDQKGALASRLLEGGKVQETLKLLARALAKNETARLWNDWATAQYFCGDLAQAETGYGRALDWNRSDPQAAVTLGLLIFARRRIQEAMLVLEEHGATLTAQEKQTVSELGADFQANPAQVVSPHVPTSTTKMEQRVGKGTNRASEQVPGGSPSRTDEKIERFAVVLVSPPGYIHIQALNEIAETVHYGLLALGHESILTTRIDEPARRSIILGAHLLRNVDAISVKTGSILYNFEQIDPGSKWVGKTYLALLAQYQVWDYSERNIARLKQNGVHNITYVPIGWMPQLTRIVPAVQDIDILFYGSMNERRARILNGLKSRNLHVEQMFGIYGKERDALIARSKIVLNLHYYESKIFEIARVSYLLGNGACVVSEDGLDPMEEHFAGALRFAPYDALVDTCLQLLSDPEARTRLATCGRERMQSRHEDQYLKDGLAFKNDTQEELRGVTVNAQNNDVRKPSDIPTILNIGSGKDWKEEALNLDIQAEWTPDVVFDLNQLLPPDGAKLTSARFGRITLKEDHFELIHAYDVFEHISQLCTAMTTCLAWLKVGGILRINVPYDLSLGAWQDPTHIRAFNENSWLYYTDWFWYLGWDRWRFDRVSLQYMLSSIGTRLKEQGSSDAELIRTPRAVDSMLVELRKRALTSNELIELNTRRPHLRN